jgi:hypothetical protein
MISVCKVPDHAASGKKVNKIIIPINTLMASIFSSQAKPYPVAIKQKKSRLESLTLHKRD